MGRKIEGCSAVLAIFLFCASPLLALDKIRVGLSSVSALHGAIWITQEKGLFRKYGIDPELIVIGGASAQGLMLRRWGMSPADVSIIQVGLSPAMLASLDKGGIDAAVLTLPSAAMVFHDAKPLVQQPCVIPDLT